jgi:hypothetical protein
MWSECSASCGEGFHSRQVTCKQTKANGTVQVVSPRACAPKDRPLGRKPCSIRPCVQQAIDPGNQVTLWLAVLSIISNLLLMNFKCKIVIRMLNLKYLFSIQMRDIICLYHMDEFDGLYHIR